MAYDVARIRSHFPALQGPGAAAHFDAPGGTQTPDLVARAVADTLTRPLANRGVVTRAERHAEEVVAEARAAMADLLGAPERGIVFGRSATALTYELARTLAKTWGPGDEVVVTRLDHDANVRPWVQAAAAVGASVRFVGLDPATGELDLTCLEDALTERTRLVATTAASNLIGTRPPLERIRDLAHGVGALHWVDGVHATAHGSVDLAALGVDAWVCSPYKFLGPHCGVLAADPAWLETLAPDKLLPSTDAVPERFELGTLPYELLAGTAAAVDFLSSLAGPGGEDSHRRDRLLASYAALHAHEVGLQLRIEGWLRDRDGVTVFSNAAQRTPTLLFRSSALDAQEIYRELAARGVNAPAGSFYAIECSRAMGLGDEGGVRVGLAPYTDDGDVDRLLGALEEIL